MVSYQHGGLRQQELSKASSYRSAGPSSHHERHVRDDGHVRIVRGDLRDGAERLGTARESDLDHLHRHVLEDRARLLGDRVLVEGEMVEHFGGVAHIRAGDDGQRMRATDAIAVTSAASPPAPLGSLALNTITQTGPGPRLRVRRAWSR